MKKVATKLSPRTGSRSTNSYLSRGHSQLSSPQFEYLHIDHGSHAN